MTEALMRPVCSRTSEVPADPTMDSLRQAAQAALCASGYRALGRLKCEVNAGVVAVSGVLPSYHLKQMAQAILLRLAHVREVKNLVEVQRNPAANLV
jgi:hypothetical protein